MNIRKAFLLPISLFAVMICEGQRNDSLEVMKATQTFLQAFVNFDWPKFRNAFSKNATIFFPSWDHAKRRHGQKEIEATWSDLFPEFIDSTKRFDLKIDPKDVMLQLFGSTAILTFHLNPEASRLSRRTIVFVKEQEEWKIAHLHASTLSKK